MLKKIFNEINAIYKHFIISFPKSNIGNFLRKQYWKVRLKNNDLLIMGYMSDIYSPDKLFLGKKFIFGDYCLIENADACGCYIGNNVGIAKSTYLRTSNHNIYNLDLNWKEAGYNYKSIEYDGSVYSIIIEDDVWIGAGCIILSGTHLGRGSVVMAGSVVASIFPNNSIVSGNPARLIGNRLKVAASMIK